MEKAFAAKHPHIDFFSLATTVPGSSEKSHAFAEKKDISYLKTEIVFEVELSLFLGLALWGQLIGKTLTFCHECFGASFILVCLIRRDQLNGYVFFCFMAGNLEIGTS